MSERQPDTNVNKGVIEESIHRSEGEDGDSPPFAVFLKAALKMGYTRVEAEKLFDSGWRLDRLHFHKLTDKDVLDK